MYTRLRDALTPFGESHQPVRRPNLGLQDNCNAYLEIQVPDRSLYARYRRHKRISMTTIRPNVQISDHVFLCGRHSLEVEFRSYFWSTSMERMTVHWSVPETSRRPLNSPYTVTDHNSCYYGDDDGSRRSISLEDVPFRITYILPLHTQEVFVLRDTFSDDPTRGNETF